MKPKNFKVLKMYTNSKQTVYALKLSTIIICEFVIILNLILQCDTFFCK